MNPKVHLSVSQIKTYIKSRQQRGGRYILGLEDEPFEDSRTVGNMFHKRIELCNGDFTRDVPVTEELVSALLSKTFGAKTKENFAEEALETFNTLKTHFLSSDTILELESKITHREKPLLHELRTDKHVPIKFKGYIDSMGDDFIVDYKSVTFFTKMGDENIPMRAGMPIRKEYELQAWLYMMGTGKKECHFVEVLKKEYKKYTRAESSQILSFVWSQDWHLQMSEQYEPIVDEIMDNYEKFDVILDNFRD